MNFGRIQSAICNIVEFSQMLEVEMAGGVDVRTDAVNFVGTIDPVEDSAAAVVEDDDG